MTLGTAAARNASRVGSY